MKYVAKIAIIFTAFLFVFGVFYAYRGFAQQGPSTPAGQGYGAISTDSKKNIGLGTANTDATTRLLVYPTSSASTYFGIKVLQYGTSNPIFTVRGDGNVGIGTSTPAYPLSVVGNIYTSGSFVGSIPASNLTSGVFGAGNFAFPASLGINTNSQVGLPQELSVYGDGYFSGSVGIGVTSPGGKLDVADLGTAPGSKFVIVGDDSFLTDLDVVNTLGIYGYQDNTVASIKLGSGGGTLSGYNSNIGIGTASPNSMLQIYGDSPALNITNTNGNAGAGGILRFGDAQSGATTDAARIFASKTCGGACNSADLLFQTASNNVLSNRMVIKDGGNVGIGLTNPGSKLTVAGVIESTAGGFKFPDGTIQTSASLGTAAGWTDDGTVVRLTNSTDNVGIGTTNPTGLLNLRGFTGGTVGSAVAGYNENLVIGGGYNQTYNSGNSVLLHILDYSNDVGENVYPIYVESENNNLDFYVKAGTTGGVGTAYFGGNVGIGTTNPTEKLHVMGAILINPVGAVDNDSSALTMNSDDDFLYDSKYVPSYSHGFIQDSGSGSYRAYISGWGGINFFSSNALNMSLVGGTLTIGSGSGKINVGTIDPIYTIDGKRFATYLSGMTGVKEETTGVIKINDTNIRMDTSNTNEYVYSLDFNNEKEGSDLWLFSKTTDLKNHFDEMTVLLSPAFDGKVWYEKNSANLKLVIHALPSPTTDHPSPDLEISYRLTAPRFDSADWSNILDGDGEAGFNLDELIKN